jgi:hypothetical protein
VMVWIHGGAFYIGSGNSDLYGPEHLINEDVVVVTINYRLGALGNYKCAFTWNEVFKPIMLYASVLGTPFFADHIRALAESFDSKLSDEGNPLVRYLRLPRSV